MLQIFIVLLAIVADQVSKYYIIGWLQPGQSYPLIGGVLHLTYIKNTGMAMGLFQNSRIVLIILSSLILAAGIFYMVKERNNKSLLFRIAISLVVGGAVGNLVDRIFRTFVVDFIDLRFINFYIFNVSDMCVCIGAVLLAAYILFHEKRKDSLKETHE